MLTSAEFVQMVQNPDQRRERYDDLLPAFYAIATAPYRGNWDESFHLPPFQGGESLHAAISAQERLLAKTAGLRSGMRVLDVGCGIGGPTLSIAGYSGAHVTGINIVPQQIDIARAKAAELGLRDLTEFRVADMMDLPFPADTFDAVISLEAICHAPDKATVYAQITRVLKPGGVFAGVDWLCADGLTPQEYRQWIEPVCRYTALPYVVSLREAADEMKAAGLVVEDCRDLARSGDMTQNWDLFDQAAASIAEPRSAEKEFMYQHCVTTAKAGRAGKLIIGSWHARKPGDHDRATA
jgi:ubiquinone/menaquinone biosynthesis C-methylase UbiE